MNPTGLKREGILTGGTLRHEDGGGVCVCGGGGGGRTIRDFPDHATFREKGAKLACADKLGVFLSLTLCNKANFDPLQ